MDVRCREEGAAGSVKEMYLRHARRWKDRRDRLCRGGGGGAGHVRSSRYIGGERQVSEYTQDLQAARERVFLLQAPEIVLQLQRCARVLEQRLLLHFFGDHQFVNYAAGCKARAEEA